MVVNVVILIRRWLNQRMFCCVTLRAPAEKKNLIRCGGEGNTKEQLDSEDDQKYKFNEVKNSLNLRVFSHEVVCSHTCYNAVGNNKKDKCWLDVVEFDVSGISVPSITYVDALFWGGVRKIMLFV